MPCELCQDSGWTRLVKDGVEHASRCACWRLHVVTHLGDAARIPTRFSRAELKNFEHDMDSQRHAWKKAQAFVEAFPVVEKGMLLYGPHGVGKTHLAVGILKEVIRTKGARGYFFETRELLRLVRDTYNQSVAETESAVLRPVLEADVLVLDDVGAERPSEWVQETLGMVVNTRYNARRATIMTSNLLDLPDITDPRTFIFQLGARTRSRLLEMCEWVELRGVDVRELGPRASAAEIGDWQRTSPSSPDNARKSSSSSLPARSRSMARARLRENEGSSDLKWSGGKAGS